MKKNFWKVAAVLACAMAFTACGDNDDDAKKCDDKNPCAANEICQADGKCVAVECTLDKKCTDAAKICSDDNKCVAKTDTLDCSKNQLCADGYSCKEGLCTKDDVVPETCDADKKCTVEGEICNDLGKCVAKSDSFECGIYAACEEGLECVEQKCVAPECSLTEKCEEGKVCNDSGVCIDKNDFFQCGVNLACENDLKCSTDNKCVECLAETDCASENCSDAGVCIECLDDNECADNTDGRTTCGANNKCVVGTVFQECDDCTGENDVCVGGIYCITKKEDGASCNEATFIDYCNPVAGGMSRDLVHCVDGEVVIDKCNTELSLYCFTDMEGYASCASVCDESKKVGDVDYIACGENESDKDVLATYTCAVAYKENVLVAFETLTDCAETGKVCSENACVSK